MRFRLVYHNRHVPITANVPDSHRCYVVPGAVAQFAADGHAVLLQQKIITTQYSMQLLHYWPVQDSCIELSVAHRFAGWIGMTVGELRLQLNTIHFPYTLLQPCVLQGLHLPKGSYDLFTPARQKYICFVAVDMHSVAQDGKVPAFARFMQRPAMRYSEWPVVFDPAAVPPLLATAMKECYEQWLLRYVMPGEAQLDLLCGLVSVAEKAVLTPSQPALTRSFERYQLQVIKAMLHTQAGQCCSNSQLAEKVGLAIDRLPVLSRQYLGMSLPKFRAQLVMDFAKESVLHTDLPIKAIAQLCGIRAPYFSPEFKKRWGQTPMEMRKGMVS